MSTADRPGPLPASVTSGKPSVESRGFVGSRTSTWQIRTGRPMRRSRASPLASSTRATPLPTVPRPSSPTPRPAAVDVTRASSDRRLGGSAAVLGRAGASRGRGASAATLAWRGATLQNWPRYTSHMSMTASARRLPVFSKCSRTSSYTSDSSSASISRVAWTSSSFSAAGNSPVSSRTYATPLVMPAPKLRPVSPSTSTVPPVMYSQPWSPTPSTTAVAPELRTQKRSPARPAANTRPPVAPYRTVLPTIVFLCGAKRAMSAGIRTISPPLMLLPR